MVNWLAGHFGCPGKDMSKTASISYLTIEAKSGL